MQLSKGINLLPSLCTTAGMFFAFFSIVRSINGDHRTAAWAILLASFFDMVDGRLARMTKTQSDFGREYDSLVDLSSFGLAPAILVYTWTLSQFRPVGWFIAFLFFACAALRLARFNVQIGVVERKRFSGLATPPAACLVATFVLFYEEVFGGMGMPAVKGIVSLIMVPILAVLMVSKIRYRSFKEYDVRRENSFYVLIGAAAVIGVIAINPNIILFLCFLVYAFSGPVFEVVMFRKSRVAKAKFVEKVKTSSKRFSVIPLAPDKEESGKKSVL